MFKPTQAMLTPAAIITKYPGETIGAVITFKHIGPAATVYVGIGIAHAATSGGLPALGHNNPFYFMSKQITVTNDSSVKDYTVNVSGNLPADTAESGKLDGQKFISKTLPVVGSVAPDDYGINNWDDDIYSMASLEQMITVVSATPFTGTPPTTPSTPTLPITAAPGDDIGALFVLKNEAPISASPAKLNLNLCFRRQGNVSGWDLFLFGIGAYIGGISTWQEGTWFDAGLISPQQTRQITIFRKVPDDWDNADIDMQLLLEGVDGEIWSQAGAFIAGSGSGGGGGGGIGDMLSSIVSLMMVMMMMQMMTGMMGTNTKTKKTPSPKPSQPSKPVEESQPIDYGKLLEKGAEIGASIAKKLLSEKGT